MARRLADDDVAEDEKRAVDPVAGDLDEVVHDHPVAVGRAGQVDDLVLDGAGGHGVEVGLEQRRAGGEGQRGQGETERAHGRRLFRVGAGWIVGRV
jgi:hypothetical protein